MPDQSTTYLSFRKNRLGCVPESVWEKTELEALVLADNDLSEFGCLRRLRMLDLGHNRLGNPNERLRFAW
jgi:hypothetical protein